jgi:hypothetical protein
MTRNLIEPDLVLLMSQADLGWKSSRQEERE